MESWDPIGVADFPEAADEYDSYLPKVGSLLRESASTEEIVGYLTGVRTERIGLLPDRSADETAAARALAWYAGAFKGRSRT